MLNCSKVVYDLMSILYHLFYKNNSSCYTKMMYVTRPQHYALGLKFFQY